MPKPTSAASKLELKHAIEVFANAIAFCRSFTYPSVAERIDGLLVVRDTERKNQKHYRREEWVGFEHPPGQANQIAKAHTRGGFCICAIRAIDESDQGIRDAYRQLNYRLGATERIMIHDLKSIARNPQPMPIVRVTTPELASLVAKGAGRKQILPEHLDSDKPLRLYTAIEKQKPAGWLRSITVGESTWVSNVYVVPEHRRKGIGKALLEKMLRDDREHGSQRSVLTATRTGTMLYDAMGYRSIGELLLYTPNR